MSHHDNLSRARAALFPVAAERSCIDASLTGALGAAHARVQAGPATSTLDIESFRSELDHFDFAEPRDLEQVLPWIIEKMEHGLVHLTSPRYFGLFNPAPTFPAQCADRIAAVFNPQLATSTTSPVPVALEAHVIRAVAERAGLSGGSTGHFTSGGAEANFTALICALTRASPGFALGGARALPGAPMFYVSSDAHLAWLKIAHQSGIGRASVRLIVTDGCGRMDCAALADAVAADRAKGHVPVMIVATAGTTNAGMIDPLTACAELARAERLWFHVDAAWGGAVIASQRLRPLLGGIERADSITIDAHKWFATTMGCGMFITTDPTILSTAFQVSTSYMPSNVEHLDPYVTSVQWSRRFLGLRLFLSLATAGWDGYGEHIQHTIDMASFLRDELQLRGWVVANDSPLAVLCIRPPVGAADARSIVSKILRSGRAWISSAKFEGEDIVRACVTHGETNPQDVMHLVDALQAARHGRI